MRAINLLEMKEISGGRRLSRSNELAPDVLPPVTLPPTNVNPPPGGGGGGGGGWTSPPPPPPSGGGGGGGHPSQSSITIDVEIINDSLGIDLTDLIEDSPTAESLLDIAVSAGDTFSYHEGSSETVYGTKNHIYIDSDYKGNAEATTSQLIHELAHSNYPTMGIPSEMTLEEYLKEELDGEGYATLCTDLAAREIAAHGDWIPPSASSATIDKLEEPYVSDYIANGDINSAIDHIADVYGSHEHVKDGRSYTQYYTDWYYAHGGKK